MSFYFDKTFYVDIDNCGTSDKTGCLLFRIEEADDTPCQNGGICATVGSSCQCVAGYSGNNCNTNINDCSPDPCQNGGTCTDGVDSYTCQCAADYNEHKCETDINDCCPDPCQNGGTCVDGVDSYTCQCVAGYTGDKCETNIDDCSPNPCQNGGTCTDGINSFTCVCEAGYTGEECQTFDVKSKCPHRVVPESWDRDKSTLIFDNIHVFVFGGPMGLRFKGTCDNAIAKWNDDGNLHDSCKIASLKYVMNDSWVDVSGYGGFLVIRDNTGARANLTYMNVSGCCMQFCMGNMLNYLISILKTFTILNPTHEK